MLPELPQERWRRNTATSGMQPRNRQPISYCGSNPTPKHLPVPQCSPRHSQVRHRSHLPSPPKQPEKSDPGRPQKLFALFPGAHRAKWVQKSHLSRCQPQGSTRGRQSLTEIKSCPDRLGHVQHWRTYPLGIQVRCASDSATAHQRIILSVRYLRPRRLQRISAAQRMGRRAPRDCEAKGGSNGACELTLLVLAQKTVNTFGRSA